MRRLATVALVLAVAIAGVACQPRASPEPSPPSVPSSDEPTLLSLEDALEILLGGVLTPASARSRVSAYLPSAPLMRGQTISSESGAQYNIERATWFVFIDDAPEALYAHGVRYVFIDAATGDYHVVAESWPPTINGASMWATAQEWHLIEIFSLLGAPTSSVAATTDAPKADYGDAPDGTPAYAGVSGRFPTHYATKNSIANRPGCHTVVTGEETIGQHVSSELGASDRADPDGVPNLVDSDSDERAFVVIEGTQARLAFTISVKSTASSATRYLNAVIDFDQNGRWTTGGAGSEWPVKNFAVDVAPGRQETLITEPFPWGNGPVAMSPVWMRALLSRQEVDASLFEPQGGWDGSGRFDYGEVEDYFVFLTEKPPPPQRISWPPAPGLPPSGDGKNGGGGGPPPAPGPAQGPCGYDVNYHVLVINCGDTSRDISKGTPIVGESCDAIRGAASDQGYGEAGNLSPSGSGANKTSIANIGNAFNQLKANVKCGDHVLVYICGHGKKDGGIAIKDSKGVTQEVMKPTDGDTDDGEDNSLKDFLQMIPACPDEDCEKPGCCCHMTVVLESCFAGNFDVDGVTGEGRSVIGTSTDTESWATYPGGGAYTQGFAEAMGDEDADEDDPPNGVEPNEAHEEGVGTVGENNQKRGKGQKPWQDSQECECRCPCEPDIDVDKWVWSAGANQWVDQIEAIPGDIVRFRIEIENTGECTDLIDVELIDEMADCLEYAGSASVDFEGEEGRRAPDRVWQGGGTLLEWSLGDLGPVSPGQVIGIEYDAEAQEPGPNLNKATSSGHCSVTYSNIVVAADLAVVLVYAEDEPPPDPVDVLHVELEVEAQSSGMGSECDSFVSIHVAAEDLTGGSYPLQNVAIYVNSLPLFDAGPLSTTSYSKTLQFEADCGQPFDILAIAINDDGMEASATASVVTPFP